MGARPSRRTGVLVVRAWLEDDRPGTFRARITSTVDVTRHEARVSTASTPAEVVRATRAWLQSLRNADE